MFLFFRESLSCLLFSGIDDRLCINDLLLFLFIGYSRKELLFVICIKNFLFLLLLRSYWFVFVWCVCLIIRGILIE